MTEPDLQKGLDYWNTQSADNDGVLGGYGNGSLPRIDALGSRTFLMHLIPELCKVDSALRPLSSGMQGDQHRIRALDVGGGVGRTTKDVLLHLVDEVVLLEPVHKFLARARNDSINWKGIANRTKAVIFVEAPLQNFDPSVAMANNAILGHAGSESFDTSGPIGFDITWCQWCLGHLSDGDLVVFLQKARCALKPLPNRVIVVKENLCRDEEDGSPRSIFDPQDSSFTRSNAKWLQLFEEAGLRVISQRVQGGFPPELYKVCTAIAGCCFRWSTERHGSYGCSKLDSKPHNK